MASFDPKVYRNEVLKSASRGETLEQLKEVLAELQRNNSSTSYVRLDLHALYRVPDPASENELSEWHGKIVPALNKASQLPAASLLKQLLEVLAGQGNDLRSPEFWASLRAQRQKNVLAALETAVQQLRAEYPLGVVTLEDLTSRLEASGVRDLTSGSIRSAAQSKGLTVYESFDPMAEAVPSALKPAWKDLARYTEFASALDVILLHRDGPLAGATFIDSFSDGASRITVKDIEQARLKSEQGRDTDGLQSAQKFLGALKSQCADDAQLRSFVIATLVELVSKHLHRGRPQVAVRDHLVTIGYGEQDASRIVAAVVAASGRGSAPRVGLDDVRALLQQGLLTDADRMLRAIEADPEDAAGHTALAKQIAHALQNKELALERYRTAWEARDVVGATAAINEAIGLDRGDDSLPALRDGLPPGAPTALEVRMEQTAVVLNWARDPDESITYVVVRAEGYDPATPTDGKRLLERGTDPGFRDEQPPIAATVHYGVFATRDDRSYSDVAATRLLVLPTVTGVQTTTEPSSARLTWDPPRGAVSVVVTRLDPDGSRTEHEVSNESRLHVTELTAGATYRFVLRAAYLLDTGRQLSDPVSTVVIPRGRAEPVRDLQIVQSAGGDDALEASWSSVDGFEVELWAFPRETLIVEGESLDEAHMAQRGGTRLRGTSTAVSGSNRTVVQLSSMPDVVRIAPMIRTDSGLLSGTSVITGSAPAARDVVAEVFGDELRVSWRWPDGDFVMELSWSHGGRRRSRRITQARYRAEGGAALPQASSIEDLRLATIVRLEDEEWKSQGVLIPLAGVGGSRRAEYSMTIKRSLLGGRTCQIAATAEATGFKMPVDVVFKEGTVMPYDVTDGQIIRHIELDFTDSTNVEVEVALRKAKSPFWVCVFPSDDSELIPPPTSDLKG